MGAGQNGETPYNKELDEIREEAPVYRPTLEPTKGTLEWYAWAYDRCEIDAGFEAQVKAAADRVLQGKERYNKVAEEIGCPWFFVGALHNMEASCSFAGVLHNGERIIGTGRKTSLVPAGRGPFSSWEEAAIDALRLKKYHEVKDWRISNMLYLAERYNGTGYLKYHQEENTPYLWACTNINDGKGKYVADGRYDENAPTNGQVGVAAIFKKVWV